MRTISHRRGRGLRVLLALALLPALGLGTPAPIPACEPPLTPFNMEVIGHSGGIIDSVAVSGDHLLAVQGNALVSFDVSAGTFASAGSAALPDAGGSLFVNGNRAYVVGDHGFSLFDIADSGSPVLLGSADMPSEEYNIEGFFAAGDYAYAGYEKAGAHATKVFDVSDPIAPALVGYYEVAFQGNAEVGNGAAYAKTPAGGLLVIDIATAGVPRAAATLTYAKPVDSVALAGSALYVATYSAGTGDLVTYSLASPLAPALEDTTPGPLVSADAAGSRLWGIDPAGYVVAWDIGSDPLAPAFTHDVAVASPLELAAYDTNRVAVLTGNASGTVVSLAMDAAGAITTTAASAAKPGDDCVALAEGFAFVGSPSGVRSLDASAAGFPLLDLLPIAGGANDIVLSPDAQTAYVATGNGLSLVDVSNPAAMNIIGSQADAGGLERLAVSGDGATVFGATGETVVAIDVDPPATIPIVDTLVFADPVTDLDAAGTRLWITRATGDSSGIIEEYDASVPSDLNFLNDHSLPGGSPSVTVDGGFAFTGLTDPGWGGSYAKIFDVSTAGNLTYIQYHSLGNRTATDVSAVDGRLASVGEGGVLLTDVSDTDLAYTLGYVPVPGSRVACLGDLIAVTHPDGGTTFMRYDPVTLRTFGGDRFDTAIALSQTFASSEYVVLATGRSYPDALAGVPLAYALNAPVLLTEAGSIPPRVSEEIERLGATRAIVLGGTSAVSDSVIAQLRSMGFAAGNIERLSGATRYETARAIALRLELIKGDGNIDRVFIATGRNFPDALAAAGAAAKAGCPILLVKPGDANYPALSAIGYLDADDSVIVGGTAVVPADIVAGLPSPERLYGATRYETAVAIANWSMTDPASAFSAQELFVVTGLNFPDALSSGVVAARNSAPTVLVGTEPPASTLGFVQDHAAQIDAVSVIGGDAAVCSEVEHWIAAYAAK